MKSTGALEWIIERLLFLCAALSVLTTAGIVSVLAFETYEFLQEVSVLEFLTGTEWTPLFATQQFGVLPVDPVRRDRHGHVALRREQPQVGRDPVPGLQPDDVAGDDLLGVEAGLDGFLQPVGLGLGEDTPELVLTHRYQGFAGAHQVRAAEVVGGAPWP